VINFADYANRVRCAAPLPPVPENERRPLRYFLDLEAEREDHTLRPGGGVTCGRLRDYTTGNVARLREHVEVLKGAP
jgi:hypothetical protein